MIDGAAGAAWAPGGTLRGVFAFTIVDGTITAIDVFADPERIEQFDVEFITQ
jgi:RNA polymerase sigma-70 factor (ECF subfamily)